MSKSNQANKFSVQSNVNALTKCNAHYLTQCEARGKSPVLNRDGMQPDIASGIATLRALTDAQVEVISALGLTKSFTQAIASAPVKFAKRFPQLLAFLASGDHRALAGSARTAVLVTAAVAVCGAKNDNGARFVATGRGDENTSDSVSIQRVRDNVAKILGQTSPASYATQKSVAYGRNGMCCALGMGSPATSKGGIPTIDADNAVTRATLAAVAKLSSIATDDLAQSVQGTDE